MENQEVPAGTIQPTTPEVCPPDKKDLTLVQRIFRTGLGKKVLAGLGVIGITVAGAACNTQPEYDKTPINPASAMATRTAGDQATATAVVTNKQIDNDIIKQTYKDIPATSQTQIAQRKAP